MAGRIRVSILSNSRLFREAILSRLAVEEEIEVVGTAGTADDLAASGWAKSIDVMLVYSSGELAEAAELVWKVKTFLPSARVIALGCEQSESEVVGCIEAGASHCLESGAPFAELLASIRNVFQGRTACSLAILARVVRRIEELAQIQPEAEGGEPEPLSFRESEVAQLIASGLINKQIARRLSIKPGTVKNHVHNILQKLRVKRRWDVARVPLTEWTQ